jgi:kynureninase
LDEADALADFRDRFVFADDLLYLDGNSLGRLPKATAGRLRRDIEDEWGSGLIRSWDDWMEWPRRVGDALGEHVVGATAGQVVVADSTTVNLYKLAAGALTMAGSGRPVIVTDSANFPTDRYVFEQLGPVRMVDVVSADAVEDACRPGDVGLVSFSHVAYRSGELADAAAVTAAAHDAGALVLWDLSHSAGAVAVGLDDWDVDFATGCTYKYLNSGPGAPAFAYVARRHQRVFRQPIWGWVGQRDPFEMGPAYDPDPGVGQFLSGTPPILGVAAIDEGVRLIAEAGVDALRVKGIAMTQLVIDLADAWLAVRPASSGPP